MSTTYTTNYHLGKQEDTSDNFNMSVITENMDIIDTALCVPPIPEMPFTLGYYINTSGEITAYTTNPINFGYKEIYTKNATQIITNAVTGVAGTIAFYNENEEVISATIYNSAGEKVIQIPDEAYIARITNCYAGGTVNCENPYVYVQGAIYSDLDYILNKINIWTGKKCVQLGDSITWYDGHTNSIGEFVKGYASYLKELGMTVDNLGVSGAYITNQSNFNDICEVAEITDFSEYDIVTIAGGVNDYIYGNSIIGDFADNNFNKSIFTQAYQYIIEKILADNPTIQIAIFTPLKQCRKTDANTQGKYLSDYVDRIKEIAERYSIPVFDQYSICGFNNKTFDIFTADDLHPSNAGYKAICEHKLKSFIESI